MLYLGPAKLWCLRTAGCAACDFLSGMADSCLSAVFPPPVFSFSPFSFSSFLAASSHCFSRTARSLDSFFSSQHFLYFFPEPQGQGSLRPISGMGALLIGCFFVNERPPLSKERAPLRRADRLRYRRPPPRRR